MNADTYRHPSDCREVWLRLANKFPATYNTPPAKPCARARDSLAVILMAHGNSPQRAALAFRDWLAEYDLKTKDFETAVSVFEAVAEEKANQYAD